MIDLRTNRATINISLFDANHYACFFSAKAQIMYVSGRIPVCASDRGELSRPAEGSGGSEAAADF
jgi:hypothetical protein